MSNKDQHSNSVYFQSLLAFSNILFILKLWIGTLKSLILICPYSFIFQQFTTIFNPHDKTCVLLLRSKYWELPLCKGSSHEDIQSPHDTLPNYELRSLQTHECSSPCPRNIWESHELPQHWVHKFPAECDTHKHGRDAKRLG